MTVSDILTFYEFVKIVIRINYPAASSGVSIVIPAKAGIQLQI